MKNTIKLIKNNDNRDETDLEWITELYEFLQGKLPDGDKVRMGKTHIPKLSAKKAYSIIWYLQEHFSILPDNINQCDVCKDLFDSDSGGIYWETKGKHYCGGCDYLVPMNYDRGRR